MNNILSVLDNYTLDNAEDIAMGREIFDEVYQNCGDLLLNKI